MVTNRFSIIFILTMMDFIFTEEVDLSCNTESIEICYSTIAASSLLSQAIPYATDEDLDKFCKRYDSFSTCYSPVRKKCLSVLPLSLVAQWEGDFASHGFQCHAGRRDYELSKSCFEKLNLQSETKQCVVTLNSQMKIISKEKDTVVKTAKICDAGSIYIGCVKNYVDVICKNPVALNWIETFNMKALYPLLSAFVCPGFDAPATIMPPTKPNAMPIVLGVLLGLFCVVIVITIIFLLCFCFRNKSYQSFPCLNSLLERCRKQPPPYHPSSRCGNSRAPESNISSSIQLDQDYFHDPALPSTTYQSLKHNYVAKYVQDVSHQKSISPHESPSKGMQVSALFRSKAAETMSSKDSAVSCTSSPSLYFEPPTSNPFTRSLSISNSNLDDLPSQTVTQDYY